MSARRTLSSGVCAGLIQPGHWVYSVWPALLQPREGRGEFHDSFLKKAVNRRRTTAGGIPVRKGSDTGGRRR